MRVKAREADWKSEIQATVPLLRSVIFRWLITLGRPHTRCTANSQLGANSSAGIHLHFRKCSSAAAPLLTLTPNLITMPIGRHHTGEQELIAQNRLRLWRSSSSPNVTQNDGGLCILK